MAGWGPLTAVLFLFSSPLFAASLFNPRYDGALLSAMDQTFRMDYAKAESTVTQLPFDAPERPYFAGLACVSRFQDLGDTAALRRGENFWNKLVESPRSFHGDSAQVLLYRGLAALQLSYVASIRGSTFRAASMAWTARGLLLPIAGRPEADAGLALFDYYREHVLEKIRFLPFVNPNADLPFQRLEAAVNNSRYLHDGLRVSVFWIHVDRKETDSALKIVDAFLMRYPNNRLARQMRGSALYRGGRLNEARLVYEGLLPEYTALKTTSPNFPAIGYSSSVGNLARIYFGLGMKAQAGARLAEWRALCRSGLEPWLPTSLKKDLEKF